MTANNSKRTAKGKSSANPANYSKLYKQSDENVAQNVSAAAPTSTATAPAVASAAKRTSAEVDWRTEYGFVFSDLRKLLIVSVALFALIVVLGFFF